MSEVVDLHGNAGLPAPKLHDVPGLLRRLADRIEAGEHGAVRNAMVVVESAGFDVEVLGFGPDGGAAAHAVGLLEWGKHWLMSRVFRIAEEE